MHTKVAVPRKALVQKGCRTCRPGIPLPQLRSNVSLNHIAPESAAGRFCRLGTTVELQFVRSNSQITQVLRTLDAISVSLELHLA
jgi:hypothetical protein